jgi:hypothetical protein
VPRTDRAVTPDHERGRQADEQTERSLYVLTIISIQYGVVHPALLNKVAGSFEVIQDRDADDLKAGRLVPGYRTPIDPS